MIVPAAWPPAAIFTTQNALGGAPYRFPISAMSPVIDSMQNLLNLAQIFLRQEINTDTVEAAIAAPTILLVVQNRRNIPIKNTA